MAGSTKQKKIDDLIAKARESLLQSAWFDAERLALKALHMARQEQDFERMAAAIPLLQEARRHRRELALQVGNVKVIDGPITEDMKIRKGCYMVQPPQVGSDARRLRLAGVNADVPVAVICREPLTRSGQIPVVAISPGSTIRVKLDPPENPEAPDLEWFTEGLLALGDSAIESLDPTLPIIRRIDALIEMLDAHPDHDGLHYALEVACKQAQQECQESARAAAVKSAAKSKVKS